MTDTNKFIYLFIFFSPNLSIAPLFLYHKLEKCSPISPVISSYVG